MVTLKTLKPIFALSSEFNSQIIEKTHLLSLSFKDPLALYY